MTATIEDVFWAAHEGLPREAPGSPATTELVLRLAGRLPAARLDELARTGTDPAMLAEVGREIDVRREHDTDYGYTAYVLRPR